MKTAISIPDHLFETAEGLCKRHRIARSRFYAMAIQRLINEYRENDVTERLNRVYRQESSVMDSTLTTAQIQTIKKEEW